MLAIEGGRGEAAVEGGGQGLQIAIALENEDVAVVAVGATLGDDIDDAVSGTADLGGESRSSNLKLLDGVRRKIGEGPANYFVIVVAAIDSDVATSSKASCGADF